MPLNKTIQDIKTLKIQGATAIAKAALLEMSDFGKKLPARGWSASGGKAKNTKQFIKQIKKAGEQLAYARPTEPMAQNLVKLIIAKLKKMVKQGADIKQTKEILEFLINHELRELEQDHQQMVSNGVKLIKNNDKILTFCHSSSVEKILIKAHKQRKKIKVIVPETRPLFQGRITAKNLSKAGIDVIMIIDSKTDKLLNSKKINKVLIGADVILKDGSIINKVGSFGIAEDAHQHKIPVYIAAITLKKNQGKVPIRIEKRHKYEVWKKAPKNINIENPAFDKVPAKFITGIITEKGILK